MVGSPESVPSLRTAVATLLTDPQDVALAQSITGTAEPRGSVRFVRDYVHAGGGLSTTSNDDA